MATQQLDTSDEQELARATPVRDALPWTPSALGPGSRWRPEIQALRALAVSLVIAAHIWPDLVPGGFVGVDVFFAVSGFLITSLLVEEIVESGRVNLSAFWARRARRILPAALLTLLVTALATLIVVPSHRWDAFLTEIATSAAYVENWQLAHSAVDYFAKADGISPVQHYWSLSVEEQFYIVWPLLLLGTLLVTRGRAVRVRIGALALAMGVLTAVSLWWSIVHTPADPQAAYFVTPTRAWEFGAGGVLALLPQLDRSPALLRALLSWLGFVAIGVAAFAYGSGTIFPGSAALLPILGALAVIRAGAPDHALAPTRVLRLGAVQRTGDLSYSLYLWHWPLLVLIPYVVHLPDGVFQAVVLELTVMLAWGSKRFVEDPVRRAEGLARRPRRTLALAGLATLLVLAVPATGALHLQHELHADQQSTADLIREHPRCFGAAARPPAAAPCDNPELQGKVVPTPVEASSSPNTPCRVVERLGRVRACAFGQPAPGASETVAVVGDSHASHWRAAFDYVARQRHWHGLSVTHTGCPFTRAVAALPQPARTQCVQWNRDTLRWFAQHPEIHRVFVAQHTGGAIVGHKGLDARFAAQVSGYRTAWAMLPPSVTQVVVLRDTPKMRTATLDCVQKAMDGGQPAARACAVPRALALERDPAVAAAGGPSAARKIGVVDLTNTLCDRRSCYPVVGGALTFKDVDHLTTVFAATLGPYLQAAVQRLS
ncbi:O-antigen acetylase [Baekduia alba]|uniref:acyltransferase family protein n=1 Tax=Baekduia alba TaxID=2997333 RepID=UPI0023423AB1|nr:acyltransferase family protein [Baekduia alba]WCB92225.1 O-antigen acetylase [Baekduia alba]